MRIAVFFYLVILLHFIAGCQSETEIVNREIRIVDTVEVDHDSAFIGGVFFDFIYCDEYMQNEDTIIPGAEVIVRLADTILKSYEDRNGLLKISGLEAGKYYEAEVYLKERFYGSFPIGPAGANIYADHTPQFFLIDISNTELESSTAFISKDTLGRLNVLFTVKLKLLVPPFSFNGRGALICLSRSPEVSNYDAELYRSNVILYHTDDTTDILNVGINENALLNSGFQKGDLVYYKIYGGSRDKTASSTYAISAYFGHEFAFHPYITVNPNYLEGSFVWEE